MSSDVISHHAPRRKREPKRSRRGGWRGYFARRFGALLITLIALGVATFIAPLFRPQPVEAPPSAVTEALTPAAEPDLVEIDVAVDLAGPPPARQRRARRAANSGIPLDANGELAEDGYEILSAAELDAISQARN